MDEGVLIVLAKPTQLKHPHPQCLFIVNWSPVGLMQNQYKVNKT